MVCSPEFSGVVLVESPPSHTPIQQGVHHLATFSANGASLHIVLLAVVYYSPLAGNVVSVLMLTL